MTSIQEKELENIPVARRNVFVRAWSGKSLSSAVKANCIQCLGYEDISGITECTGAVCPLFLYRPYRHDKAREGAPRTETQLAAAKAAGARLLACRRNKAGA